MCFFVRRFCPSGVLNIAVTYAFAEAIVARYIVAHVIMLRAKVVKYIIVMAIFDEAKI